MMSEFSSEFILQHQIKAKGKNRERQRDANFVDFIWVVPKLGLRVITSTKIPFFYLCLLRMGTSQSMYLTLRVAQINQTRTTHRTPALHWSTVNLDHVASGEAYGHIQSG